jgi:hypothetical protein
MEVHLKESERWLRQAEYDLRPYTKEPFYGSALERVREVAQAG